MSILIVDYMKYPFRNFQLNNVYTKCHWAQIFLIAKWTHLILFMDTINEPYSNILFYQCQ